MNAAMEDHSVCVVLKYRPKTKAMTTINMCNYFINVWQCLSACSLMKFLYTVNCTLYITVLHLLYDFFQSRIKTTVIILLMGPGPLCWVRNQCASAWIQTSLWWRWCNSLSRCMLSIPNIPPLCEWYCDNRYYLHINDAAIGSLHEWHRPDHIFTAPLGHICWRWGTPNGVVFKTDKKPTKNPCDVSWVTM